MRPLTPPASLARLKAVSMPSFIWRPSSLDAPEKGATIPKRISLSVTPWTFWWVSGTAGMTFGFTATGVTGAAGGAAGGTIVATGAGAAFAAAGAITDASDGPETD